MTGLERYPDWTSSTPHTDPRARVCRFRLVANVRAVRVTNGTYRNAPVSGVFELYEPHHSPVETLPGGKRQVKVICAWHGVRPSKSCARIDVGGSEAVVEVLESFTGEVVDNIGYETDPLPLGADEFRRRAAEVDSGAVNPVSWDEVRKQARAQLDKEATMQTVKYVHWQEDGGWLGYLQDYPDYWTQGDTLDDLLEHLADLYHDLSGGHIPGARKVGELVIP